MLNFKGKAGADLALVWNELFHEFSEEGEREKFEKKVSQLEDSEQEFIVNLMSERLADDEIVKFINHSENKIKICGALFALVSELEHTKNRVLLRACIELVRNASVSEYFDDKYFGFWEQPLVINKNLSGDDIELIWKISSHKYPFAYGTPARDIAKHPNTPVTILKALYHFDSEGPLRESIAKHKNLDSELTELFLNSKRKKERIALAKSKFIASKDLIKLSADKDKDVKIWADRNLSKRS